MKTQPLQTSKKHRGQMSSMGEDLPAFILITIGIAMLLVAISGTWNTFNEKNKIIDEKKAVIEIFESIRGNGVIDLLEIQTNGIDSNGNVTWDKWTNLDALGKRYQVKFKAEFFEHNPKITPTSWVQVLKNINFGPKKIPDTNTKTILYAPVAIKESKNNSIIYKNGRIKVTIWKQ